MAEYERREAISARTKAALAAAKARGVKLGGPKLKQAQRRGIASNKTNADRFAANVLPVIKQIKSSGARSLRAIAKALNARGVATARGGDARASDGCDAACRLSAIEVGLGAATRNGCRKPAKWSMLRLPQTRPPYAAWLDEASTKTRLRH